MVIKKEHIKEDTKQQSRMPHEPSPCDIKPFFELVLLTKLFSPPVARQGAWGESPDSHADVLRADVVP